MGVDLDQLTEKICKLDRSNIVLNICLNEALNMLGASGSSVANLQGRRGGGCESSHLHNQRILHG